MYARKNEKYNILESLTICRVSNGPPLKLLWLPNAS